jgi:hypothetical protein
MPFKTSAENHDKVREKSSGRVQMQTSGIQQSRKLLNELAIAEPVPNIFTVTDLPARIAGDFRSAWTVFLYGAL